MIDKINKRIEELKKSLTNMQNNANAHIGAIQELEKLRDELVKETEQKEEIEKK